MHILGNVVVVLQKPLKYLCEEKLASGIRAVAARMRGSDRIPGSLLFLELAFFCSVTITY